MERRSRWLGYVAIGLGVLALVVSLSGRSFGPRSFERSTSGAAPQADGRSVAPDSAQGPAAPDRGPRAIHPRMEAPASPRFERGPRFGHDFGRGPHMPFLAFPFMLLRGLRDALIALVLIVIGVRIFRGRSGGGSQSSEPTQL